MSQEDHNDPEIRGSTTTSTLFLIVENSMILDKVYKALLCGETIIYLKSSNFKCLLVN
jgi:hypothetical protein